jgi:hypothetical protein
MEKSNFGKSYTFNKPGNYRIRVQGTLDESWSDSWLVCISPQTGEWINRW